ncbi:hypothetical protein AB0B50_00225 [Streptomyces sp. NPDC041068]|uniref:hypothetical protein n=1 Tax=Streptomyces sp. NPDC041068 TaxID=3155130 RepID=UPI00340FC636
MVFDRLDPSPFGGRGLRPPTVRRWLNIAGVGDHVAPPRRLRRAFDGVDDGVWTSIARVDFHKFGNYLAGDTMEKVLRSAGV